MDKLQAVDDIRTIREIVERSTKYTHFTGLSGVISGFAALVGTYITWWIYCSSLPVMMQGVWSLVTWVAVFVFAIGQDFLLAQRRDVQHAGGRHLRRCAACDGAASLFFMLGLPLDAALAPYSIGTLALCFGVYQIIFGLVIAARYGR